MDGTSIKFNDVRFPGTNGLDLLVDSTSINLSIVQERDRREIKVHLYSPNNQEIIVTNL